VRLAALCQSVIMERWGDLAIDWSALRAQLCRERARLLKPALPNDGSGSKPGAGGGQPAKRRTGRPRKGESDKEWLVIGALAVHHEWQTGGSVGNDTPAKTKPLAKLASDEHVTVSDATVSRFFTKKFPGRGYKGYRAACVNGTIGTLLASWQGEMPKHQAGLMPHESGREDED